MESKTDRRRWPRTAQAFTVMARAEDVQGVAFTELAVALNISRGGALLVLHKPVPLDSCVTLEVPRSPATAVAEILSGPQSIQAKVVRLELRETCQLLGLQFLPQQTTPPGAGIA